MSVRVAIETDARDIAFVQVTSWQTAYKGLVADDHLQNMSIAKREQTWRQIISKGESHCLVVEINKQIIGFANMGISRDPDKIVPPTGEIYAIYLLPTHWRQGLGQQLFNEAIKWLNAQNLPESVIWVLEGNWPARRFYEKQGFRPDGVTKTKQVGGDERHVVRYARTIR